MRLGATQYAACPDGRDYISNAAAAGLEGVEPYIDNRDDPFLSWGSDQMRELRQRAADADMQIPSVALGVFNYDSSIVSAGGQERAVGLARRGMEFTAGVGGRVMLLCTYLASAPDTPEKQARLLDVVRQLVPLAERLDLKIALENPLPADVLARLIDHAESDRVGVYYDFGNALANGFDPAKELPILGRRRIFAVHAKDSVRNKLGGKHLGDGDLDLVAAMNALKSIGYDDWLLLETPAADHLTLDRNVHAIRRYL